MCVYIPVLYLEVSRVIEGGEEYFALGSTTNRVRCGVVQVSSARVHFD